MIKKQTHTQTHALILKFLEFKKGKCFKLYLQTVTVTGYWKEMPNS